MLSKASVDKVFMHHFEKLSSVLGLYPHIPTGQLSLDPAWGLPFFRPPHCPPLEKILQVPMTTTRPPTNLFSPLCFSWPACNYSSYCISCL